MTEALDVGCLILTNSHAVWEIHNLTRGQCNIGSGIENTICLKEVEGVAPLQCCITVANDGSATLTAYSCFHETKLDGMVIQEGKAFDLKHDSVILVGNLSIKYHNPNFKKTNANVKVKRKFKWNKPKGKPPALKGQKMNVKPKSGVKKDNLQTDVDHQVENTNYISTTPNIHHTRNAIEDANLYNGNTLFVGCKTDNVINDNNWTSTDINQFSVTDEYDGNSAMQSAHNSALSSFFYKDISSSSELIYDPDEKDISTRLPYVAGEGYISDCEEYEEDDYYLMVENSQSEDEMLISEVANDTTCVAESHAQTFDFGHISEELDEVTTTTIENTLSTSALIHNQLSDGDELKVSNEEGITSFRNRSKSVEIQSESANITNIGEIEELSVCSSVNQSPTEICTIRRRTKSSKESTEFISGIEEFPLDNFVNCTRSKRKCHNETEIFDLDDVLQTSTPSIYNVSNKMNVSSGQKESNMKQMYETSKPIGKQTSSASHVNTSLNTLEMEHSCDTPNVKNSIIDTLAGTGRSSNSPKVKKIVNTPHVQKSINGPQVSFQDSTVKHSVSKSNSKGDQAMLKTPFVQKSINNLQCLTSKHDKPTPKEIVKMPYVTLGSSSDISNINHFLNASCAKKSNTPRITLERFVIKKKESTPNTEGVKKTVKIPQIRKTTSNVTLPNLAREQDEPTFDFESVGEMYQIPRFMVSTGNREIVSEYLMPKHNQSASNFKRSKESLKTPHGEKSTDNPDAALESFILESNKPNLNSKGGRVVLKTPPGDMFMNVYDKKRLLQTPNVGKLTNAKSPTLESSALQHDKFNNPSDSLESFARGHNESESNPKGGRMSGVTPCSDRVFRVSGAKLLSQTVLVEDPISGSDDALASSAFQHDESNSKICKILVKTPHGEKFVHLSGMDILDQTPYTEKTTNSPTATLESFTTEHYKTNSNFVGVREMFKTPLADKSANVSNMQFLFQTPHVEKSTNDDNDHNKSENNENSKAHDSQQQPEDYFTAVFNKKPIRTYRDKSLSPLKVSGKVNLDNQGFSTSTKIRSSGLSLKSKENMLPKSSPRKTKRRWQMNRRYSDAYVTGMNPFFLNQSLKRNNEGGSQVEEMLTLYNQSDDSKSENTDLPRNIMLQIEEALNKYKEIVCSFACEGFFDSKCTSNNLTEFLVKQLMKIDVLRKQGDKEEKNLEKPSLAHNKKQDGKAMMGSDVGHEVVSKASVEQVLTDLNDLDIDEIVSVFERDLKYHESQKSKGLPNENSPGHKVESTQKSDSKCEAGTSTKNDKNEARSNVIEPQAPETTKKILTNSNQLKSSPRKARRGRKKMEAKIKSADVITKEVHVKIEILDVDNTKLTKTHCLVSNELQSSLKRTRCANKEGSNRNENLEDSVKSIKTSDHKTTMPVNSAENSRKIKSRKRCSIEPDTPKPSLKRAKRCYKKASLKGDNMIVKSNSTACPIQKRTSTSLESAENSNKQQSLPRGTKSGHKELSSLDDPKAKSNIKKHPTDKEALMSLELNPSVEICNIQQLFSRSTKRGRKKGVNAESGSKGQCAKKEASKRFEAGGTAKENLNEPQFHPGRMKGDHIETQPNEDQSAKGSSRLLRLGTKATSTSLAADDASRDRVDKEERFRARKTRRAGKAAKKVSFAGDILPLKDVVRSRGRPRRVQSDQPLDDWSRTVGRKRRYSVHVRFNRTPSGLSGILYDSETQQQRCSSESATQIESSVLCE